MAIPVISAETAEIGEIRSVIGEMRWDVLLSLSSVIQAVQTAVVLTEILSSAALMSSANEISLGYII